MSADWTIDTTIALLALAVSVVSLGLGVWSLPGWHDYQTWLKADPGYRNKTVEALRHPRWVALHRDGLAKALDGLDRRFGEAGSARALGVCTVISLCYAWAAFFLGYGMGQPGRLGEIDLLPASLEGRDRWALAAVAVILPPVAYALGRWLGRFADHAERRLKARLLKRRRRQGTRLDRRRFERSYRWTSAIVVLAILLALMIPLAFVDRGPPLYDAAVLASMGIVFATGPIFGLAIARHAGSSWLKGPAAAIAVAVAVAVAVAGAGAFAVAFAVAVAGAGAAAAAGAVAFAGAVAGAGAAAAAGAVAFAGAVALAVAVAVAGAIGAITATRWGDRDWRGAFAGGIGMLLAFAIVFPARDGDVDNAVAILIITFLLLLPLANGFWDWLSWRVSRGLGRDLLRRLESGERQVWAIVGHGLLDLVLALVLLTSLAFALAFGVEGYNQFAEWRSDKEVYDLAAFVREAAANPWTEGFWLTAMLLSTLVPTLLHFSLLLASPLALMAGSTRRTELAADLAGYEKAEHPDAVLQNVGWHLAITQYLAWAGAAVLTIALLTLFAGFVRLIHQGGLADYVVTIATAAIRLARWSF